MNVTGSGANGDSAPQFVQPSAQPAQSLGDYANWSGDGINFKAINTALIGPGN